jgi:hypothetical protein
MDPAPGGMPETPGWPLSRRHGGVIGQAAIAPIPASPSRTALTTPGAGTLRNERPLRAIPAAHLCPHTAPKCREGSDLLFQESASVPWQEPRTAPPARESYAGSKPQVYCSLTCNYPARGEDGHQVAVLDDTRAPHTGARHAGGILCGPGHAASADTAVSGAGQRATRR